MIKKLGDFIKQCRNTVWVDNDKIYKQVTISQTGKVSLRGSKSGADIGRKRQFVIDLIKHPNTLIFIRQGVFDGGIGIAPEEVDGCIATENMPMFDIVGVNPLYLELYLKTPFFKKEVKKMVPTGSAQKSIHERDLLKIEINIPSPERQVEVVKQIQLFNQKYRPIEIENTKQFELLKKFRNSILQDAIQGKLVPQDSNDEPAEKLLEKIKIEKERLIKEGKIKKEKPIFLTPENEYPFELPKGWVWSRAEDFCTQITDGTHHTPTYVQSGIPFLSVKDLTGGKLEFANSKFISKEEHLELSKRCHPEFNNVLLTKVGTTGIARVIDTKEEFSIFVSLSLLKFNPNLIDPYYLELCINSPYVRKLSKDGTEGIGNKNLVLRKIKAFLLPIPPLNEQKRIVEKVNSLLKICDEQEKNIREAKENIDKLNQAILREMFQ